MNRISVGLVALMSVAFLCGCSRVPQPEFRQNYVQLIDKKITEEQQYSIGDILVAMYGTPDDPFVPPGSGLDLQKITMAAGPVRMDQTGAQRGLFREHCAHCHGVTGDGMGPTAVFLKPYPRDYRQGLYKFKSTPSNYPPTHDDLMKVVNEGITGTAMPSFKLLPKDEVEALVEYVKYLSYRGQTEIALIDYVTNEGKLPAENELVSEVLNGITGPVTRWNLAPSQVTKIPDPPANFRSRESIERGRELFHSSTGGACVQCHGPTELGDGKTVADFWNKMIFDLDKKVANGFETLNTDESMSDEQREALQTFTDDLQHALKINSLPARESDPRNLRQGIFRGGRAPYEVFYRLHNGIFAAEMPGIAQTPGMTPDDIWHLVAYVLALPYEPGSQYAPETTSPARERL